MATVRMMSQESPTKTTRTSKLDDVSTFGRRFSGRKEYLEILRGNHSTPRKRILAKCYECMGYYEDGTMDCEQEECPLYAMMPYRAGKKTKEKT